MALAAVLDRQEVLRRSIPHELPDVNPWLVTFTRFLDEAFEIPGTRYRIGFDGIVGIIPGVGDAITAIAAVFMLREAKRLGLPRHQQARMIANYAFDFLGGLVPLVGDVFDIAFKAHKRNLGILQEHVKRENPGAGRI